MRPRLNKSWRSIKAAVASSLTVATLSFALLQQGVPLLAQLGSLIQQIPFGPLLKEGIPSLTQLLLSLAGIPAPSLLISLAISGIAALGYGGFTARKRYQELQAQEKQEHTLDEQLQLAEQEVEALLKQVESLEQTTECARVTAEAKSAKQSISLAAKLPSSAPLLDQRKRYWKAFLANFPVASKWVAFLSSVGIIALQTDPIGWVIDLVAGAVALAWGTAAAVKKWQLVSTQEQRAKERWEKLQGCNEKIVQLMEKMEVLKQAPAKVQNPVFAGAGALDQAYTQPAGSMLKQFEEKLKNNSLADKFFRRPTIMTGIFGACTGAALAKYGLALLLVAVGITPAGWVALAVTAAVALGVGLAAAKIKYDRLQRQFENDCVSRAMQSSIDWSTKVLAQEKKVLEARLTYQQAHRSAAVAEKPDKSLDDVKHSPRLSVSKEETEVAIEARRPITPKVEPQVNNPKLSISFNSFFNKLKPQAKPQNKIELEKSAATSSNVKQQAANSKSPTFSFSFFNKKPQPKPQQEIEMEVIKDHRQPFDNAA